MGSSGEPSQWYKSGNLQVHPPSGVHPEIANEQNTDHPGKGQAPLALPHVVSPLPGVDSFGARKFSVALALVHDPGPLIPVGMVRWVGASWTQRLRRDTDVSSWQLPESAGTLVNRGGYGRQRIATHLRFVLASRALTGAPA